MADTAFLNEIERKHGFGLRTWLTRNDLMALQLIMTRARHHNERIQCFMRHLEQSNDLMDMQRLLRLSTR